MPIVSLIAIQIVVTGFILWYVFSPDSVTKQLTELSNSDLHLYKLYNHHGRDVWVRSDLKGRHRDFCLCFSCDNFHPGQRINCIIAQELYQNYLNFSVVTPVWECPHFKEKKS